MQYARSMPSCLGMQYALAIYMPRMLAYGLQYARYMPLYLGMIYAICKIYANITGPYIAIAQSMPEHDKNEHIYFSKS